MLSLFNKEREQTKPGYFLAFVLSGIWNPTGIFAREMEFTFCMAGGCGLSISFLQATKNITVAIAIKILLI